MIQKTFENEMPFLSEKYQISQLLTDLKVQLDFDRVFSVLIVEQTLFGEFYIFNFTIFLTIVIYNFNVIS